MTSFQKDFISDSTIKNFNKVLERSFTPYDDKILRIPFYLTSSYRQKLKIPGVSMLMNPNSLSFSQSKRITRKNTAGGAVFFHWANRSGRNNDILELEVSGQTGNIDINGSTQLAGALASSRETGGALSKGLDWLNNQANKSNRSDDVNASVLLQGSDYSVSGAAKMAAFWNLYQLTREPIVDPKTGAPIYYFISYNSPVLGNTFVTFIGHFNKVLEFSDEAQNPYSKNYSFGFTVLSSIPSLDYIFNSVTSNLRTTILNSI